jgi:hypothetical protein
MKRALRKLGLSASLLLFAMSVLTTTSAPTSVDDDVIDIQSLTNNPQVKQLMKRINTAGTQTDSLLDTHFLFASLFWGSVGTGYLLYARKQRLIVPFIAGVGMIGASYLINSWAWMSVVCVGLMVAVYKLIEWG